MNPDWLFDAAAADEAGGIEIVQVPRQTYGSVSASESLDDPGELEVRDWVAISGSAGG